VDDIHEDNLHANLNALIYTEDELLALLDQLLAGPDEAWWDGFYENRAKPCPFFVEFPDENLAESVRQGQLKRGKALDLGCGNGRNSIFLAQNGFDVDAVDFSQTAIDWATERIKQAGTPVSLHCQSVFDLQFEPESYDLVYDSGCFHHIPPHRRRQYVELVSKALKPGGWFGLTCFRPEGGSGLSDSEVYEKRSIGGGLGYTEDQLRSIWSHSLSIQSIRPMRKPGPDENLFGEDFLWVMVAQKT
jgi:SAM-dependent methyltransferase